MPPDFDTIVNLAKKRGFVFQSSEIYGGLRSAYDYGPLGVELLRNVKQQWWRSMVRLRGDVVGLDSAVIQSPEVWKASGHVASFSDPLVECRNCHNRFREDKLESLEQCPTCGKRDTFTQAREFQLMFKTNMGPVESAENTVYLSPRDGTRDLPQLRQHQADLAVEAAVRDRPDRQGVSQRDHSREVRVPNP